MVGTIGPLGAGVAVVVVVLVVVGSFAEAGFACWSTGAGTSGSIFGARRAIGFGGFTLFVQVGVDFAFFTTGFASAVLVLTGWAGRTGTIGVAVLS